MSALEQAPSVAGIILTTDDNEILELYRRRRRILLVQRPLELATDTTSSSETVTHALATWTASGRPEPATILLAQPTSPLRSAADVESAFAMLRQRRGESLVSACRAEGMRHPMDMYRVDSGGRGRAFMSAGNGVHTRASYETLYQRNGAIYMVSTEYFRRTGRLRSEHPLVFEMPWERSINIDVPGDLIIARALVESGLLGSQLSVGE